MNLILFLCALGSSQFLKMTPGVLSQGMGGASVVIDEGLAIFHNPAFSRGTQFNFTLSRWLYATNHLTAAGAYQDFLFGITYLNYGRIQGYDELGNETEVFAPYDLCIGLGRRFGVAGIGIKAFTERIEDQVLYGVCASCGFYVHGDKIAFGIRADNIGKEFGQNTAVPLLVAAGVRYRLFSDFDLLLEAKPMDLELNAGFMYRYEDLRVFMGMRYLAPDGFVEEMNLSKDVCYTGGIIVHIEDYDIGYSIVYNPLSLAHQFGIMFVPGNGN